MNRTHEEFEMLTAFAAINQLSDHESYALNEHLQSCASCQLQLAQMKAASFAYFSHHSARSSNRALPAAVSDRFSRKLTNLGISPSSLSIANPVRSLRVAMAILAFAILAPTVVGVLAIRHRQGFSEQTEIVPEQSVSESHAAVSTSVFNAPHRVGARARRRRPRHSGLTSEVPYQDRDLYSAEGRLPNFRWGYPEVPRKLNPEPFAMPLVPSFPAVELGRRLNGAKTFELASLLPLGQSDKSDGANALRFIPQSDLTHLGDISTPAQFRLPPLTGGSLFSTDMSR